MPLKRSATVFQDDMSSASLAAWRKLSIFLWIPVCPTFQNLVTALPHFHVFLHFYEVTRYNIAATAQIWRALPMTRLISAPREGPRIRQDDGMPPRTGNLMNPGSAGTRRNNGGFRAAQLQQGRFAASAPCKN